MRRVLPLLCVLAACGGGSAPAPAPASAPATPSAAPAPPPVAALRVVQVNGTPLHFRIAGDTGTPIVFVHGTLGDLGDWDTQVAAFAGAHRVLVYSRRYHPPNPPQNDDQPYSPQLHAEDLAALLLTLDLAPAHIVGSSYGAYIALVLALEHPELVRSVVLAEPPIMPLLTRTPEGDAMRRDFYATTLDPARSAFARGDSVGGLRAFVDGLAATPGRFDRLPAPVRTDMMAHIFELRREILTSREEHFPPLRCADLGRLHTPALLLTGERSQLRFRTIMDELARCMVSDTTVTIPSAGHAMNADNPAYYTQVLRRFLATH